MQYKNRWQYMLLVCIAGLGLVTVFRVSSVARTDTVSAPQQNVIRLETRINQLEQRMYSFENTLRSLDQQSRITGAAVRGASPEDLARLRLEVQALQHRLAEHECAIAKLDERTLSPAMRATRRKSGGTDPCRLNSYTPVQLSNQRHD
jgi:hypothetical protein